MTIRTAILGAGFSARTFHEPFLRHSDRFTLVAASGRSAGDLRAHWPQLDCFADADTLLEKSDAELVIICTPNAAHAALAIKALEQGRSVLIDKPMCCSLVEAEQLLEAEAASTGRVCVFHNRRFDGDFLTVRQLITDNAFGAVRRFESHFDRARPVPRDRWRERPGDGAGIWFDLGPHLLDQALVLFGRPDTISASIRCIRPRATVDDCFDVMLDYPTMNVRLVSSAHAWGAPPRFDIQGDRARYTKQWLDPQEDCLRSAVAFETPGWNTDPPDRYGQLADDQGVRTVATLPGDYSGFFEALADAISTSAAMPVNALEGYEVIRLLELGARSATEGRALPAA